MKKYFLVLISIATLAWTTGCGKRAFVKGDYDKDVNEENLMDDRWSETDMQKTVQFLVNSAVKHRAIANAKKPPVVMVTRLQNKTSEHIDTQSITDMITVELVNSGTVQFVDKAARDDVAEELEYQASGTTDRTSRKRRGNQVGADLILNGRIDSIVKEVGKAKTVYYKITLNLTNLSTNLIVWTNHKQIRKRYKKRRVGL